MGPIGIQEMMALVLVALLLFGPKKLPELGRILGRGLSEFRRMKSEFSRTFETHMRELEREARLSELESPKSYSPPAPYTHNTYSYPYETTHADGVAVAPIEPALPIADATTPAIEGPHEPPVIAHAPPVPDTVARAASNVYENGHHATVSDQAEAGYANAGDSAPADEAHRA